MGLTPEKEIADLCEDRGFPITGESEYHTGGYSDYQMALYPTEDNLLIKHADKGSIKTEYRALRKLQGIAKIPVAVAMWTWGHDGFLVMNRLDGNSLYTELEYVGSSLADSYEAILIASNAVSEIHDRRFVHRDIALRNILTSGGLIDFECCRPAGLVVAQRDFEDHYYEQIPPNKRGPFIIVTRTIDVYSLSHTVLTLIDEFSNDLPPRSLQPLRQRFEKAKEDITEISAWQDFAISCMGDFEELEQKLSHSSQTTPHMQLSGHA